MVYVSTAAIHSKPVAAALPGYTLSKASGHLAMQKIAAEVDANKMQIVTFHPGAILSESAKNAGMNENSYPWDDGKCCCLNSLAVKFFCLCVLPSRAFLQKLTAIVDNLPAHFAVWAATTEAATLHGRFVWATWDIKELLSGDLSKRMEIDPDFLTISFVGI